MNAKTNLWCLVAQAAINVAAALGAISGPLIIGALTERNVKDGWRNFYVGFDNPFNIAEKTDSKLSGSRWLFGE